jgi:hypothetical protein
MYTSCDWIVGQSQSPVNDLVIVNFLIKHKLCSGAVAGGAMPPPPPIVETRPEIVNVVGNCRKIVNVVGNCQSCRPGGGDLKCGRPEIFFGLSEKIFGLSEKYCPWPPKKHGSHGATGNASVSNGLKNDPSYEFIGEVILKINIV